jgi:FkbM family methyltransferase
MNIDKIDGPIGDFFIPGEPSETRRICAGLSRGVWGVPGAYDKPEGYRPEYDHLALSVSGVRRIIDVGAGWGAFAVWALARWGKEIELDCYEPNVDAVPFLIKNTIGYKVNVHQKAVTTESSAILTQGIDWGGLQTHPTGTGRAVQVIHPDDLPPCDVLKSDAEGIEPELFANYKYLSSVKIAIYEWHGQPHRAILAEICKGAGLQCVREDNGPWGDGNGTGVWIK